MKLTREQVSQLSDVELNRAMIWLYPPKCGIFEDTGCEIYCIGVKGGHGYLNDYNLTMPLAIKYELEVDFSTIITEVSHPSIGGSVSNSNPLRAICEVLLMIAMEREA